MKGTDELMRENEEKLSQLNDIFRSLAIQNQAL